MPRVIGPSDVARVLPRGGRVYVQAGASEPTALLQAIAASGDADQSFVAAFFPGVNTFELASLGAKASATVFYPTRAQAPAMAAGRVACMPLHHSEIGPYLLGVGRPDALLVQVAPPDSDGRCSLGVGADFVPLLEGQVPVIVAEVNARMPRVPGTPWIAWSRLTAVMHTDRPLPEYPDPEPDEVARAIAAHAAGLVEDGACLQAGIGALPGALARELAGRRDLSIHSGIVGDGLAGLIAQGAVTGRYKPAGQPAALAAYIAGTQATYALAAAGRLASLPPTFTHDVGVIGGIERFVSINAALEVDLFGQVNAEGIDGRAVSGGGGFVDFARGARRSRGGVSMVLLPATGKSGTRSRIVAALGAGVPVTCARADVDVVVTEYGVARLRHLDEEGRARRLIEVAAPGLRRELGEAWEVVRGRRFGVG